MKTHTQFHCTLFVGLLMLVVGILLLSSISIDPPRAEAQDPQASPTVAAQPQPTPAPQAKKPLDVLLAQGQISDPLAGNYHMVTMDRIALIWEGSGGYLNEKIYASDVITNPPVPKFRDTDSLYPLGGAKDMDVATRYHGSFVDLASVWQTGNSRIVLRDERLTGTWTRSDGSEIATDQYAYGMVRIATGNVQGYGGYDNIILAWEGGNQLLNIMVFEPRVTYPEARGKISDETLGGYKFLDVATGDFNGDGTAEIVVAFQGSDGKLAIKVYSVSSNGWTVTPQAKQTIAGSPGRLEVATGDFNGDTIDEIVVGANYAGGGTLLYLYQVSQDLKTLTQKSTKTYQVPVWTAHDELWRQVAVGAGDFNADAVDEIVLIWTSDDGSSFYNNTSAELLAADSNLSLSHKATLPTDKAKRGGDLSLAVGDVNLDLLSEFVVAYDTGSAIKVQLFQVSTNLDAITAKGSIADESPAGNRHLAVALGGFDGQNLRVGPPVYQALEDVQQILAIINEPPKHYDVIGNTAIHVDDTTDTYARYENTEKKTTSQSVGFKRTWAVGPDLQVTLGPFKIVQVTMSIKAQYGQNFEKTTSTFHSIEFGDQVNAAGDDVVVYTAIDYDVWEYPVYDDDSSPKGHILVIFPRKKDPACTSDCDAAVYIKSREGKTWDFYVPNHENHNVLSYPISAATDISQTIKCDRSNLLGTGGYEFWVNQSDITNETQKKENFWDIASPVGKFYYGGISTSTTEWQTTTSFHLTYKGLAEANKGFGYWVTPCLYYAKPDNRVVFDYVVQIPTEETSAWKSTYTKPDPAFTLPWKYDKDSKGNPVPYHLRSKDITFSPSSPKAGETVTITAKVRNYSLVSGSNVLVRFYNGDPDKGGTQIAQQTIAQLNPLSAHSVVFQWTTSGSANQVLNIYAVIDPNNAITEMHKDNNKAYAPLPLRSGLERVSPATLSVASNDIVFGPEVLGWRLIPMYITATVRAAGDTFTHVSLDFWEGDPKNGGTLIGWQSIPMVVRDQSVTESILWTPTGPPGQRDIWVTVWYPGQEDDYSDNRAHKALTLWRVIRWPHD